MNCICDLSTNNFIVLVLLDEFMVLGMTKIIIISPLISFSLRASSLPSITLNKLLLESLLEKLADKSEDDLSTKPISIGSTSPSLRPTIPKITIGNKRLKIIYCRFLKKIWIKTFVKYALGLVNILIS